MKEKYRSSIILAIDVKEQLDALYPNLNVSSQVTSIVQDYVRLHEEHNKLINQIIEKTIKK